MAKGPKSLNPADKARREARKKELKKNKKQRQQVRSAVIEKKDPEQILLDLEKLDKLEFDADDVNLATNEAFYKEKRKRIKETWTKILAYYEKEDTERHEKLKKLEQEYEVKHKRLVKEFGAIKAAREVRIEDVFLPPEVDSVLDEIADDDQLLSNLVYVTPLTEGVRPPGCPPGLPPDLKALAEGIKSMEASALIDTQPLPSNILNLSMPGHQSGYENVNTHPQQQRYRDRQKYLNSSNQVYNKKPGFPKNQNKKSDPQTTTSGSIRAAEGSQAGSSGKSTVIESKPVIFMAKATKFVPASVRSRIVPKPD